MDKNVHTQYSNSRMIKMLWKLLKPFRGTFLFASVLKVLSNVGILVLPWLIGEMINFVSDPLNRGDFQSLTIQCVLFAVVTIVSFIFLYWANFLIYPVSEKLSVDAMKETSKHLLNLDIDWHENESSGNKLQRISKGGSSLRSLVRFYIDNVIWTIVTLIAVCVLLVFLHWAILPFFILFFFIFYKLSAFLTDRATGQAHKANLDMEKYQGFVFEAVNNISTVKSLGITKKVGLIFDQISSQLIKKLKKKILYFQTRGLVLKLFVEVSSIFVLFFTIFQILKGHMEIGIIAVLMIYLTKVETVVGSFADLYHRFVMLKVDALRMLELQDLTPSVEQSGSKKFNSGWKKLSIKNLSFSYEGKGVVKGLSLDMNRGEKIGIVGISGAGKSTLFKLLLKQYVDYKGDILFDNVSLKEIKRQSYIDHMAVVLQDVELFNLSLKENITISGKRKVEEQKLRKALKIAHVKEFLHKLPKGVDTVIGEKGVKLSGGEKQRVGIARAIYSQPDLLLLDEATSHLDVNSEKMIQSALHEFLDDVTAIVIAHRLSTIREMDRIIVMHGGRISEQGTFKELIELKGRFYQMWQQQKF